MIGDINQMIDNYPFTIEPKCAVNRFAISEVISVPFEAPFETMDGEVNLTEGKFDIIYPVRHNFLEERLNKNIPYQPLNNFHIYTPFENDRIEFSTFLTTPHVLHAYAYTFFNFNQSVTIPFKLTTCGGIKIWVNQKLQVTFEPFTRNEPTSTEIELSFSEGQNELCVFFDDLAERDINYYFELINLSNSSIRGTIPLSIPSMEYENAERLLNAIFFEKDYFSDGSIQFRYPTELLDSSITLRIRVNPKWTTDKKEEKDGNITEFQFDDFYIELSPKEDVGVLGTVSDFTTAGITKFELGIPLSNGDYLTKEFTVSIFNEKKYRNILSGKTIQERKKEALNYYSQLNLHDINIGLSKILLESFDLNQDWEDFEASFKLIEEKGDCADFVLTPLLAIYCAFQDKFPYSMHKKIKELAIDFRYWIDEPGNDVMWFFSENHAFLFHICQYLAGTLYPDSIFSVSKKSGREQYKLGRERIDHWFDLFFQYGLSEWNSTTYIPIDLIGLFSLFIAAPDDNIKKKAKKALDTLFEIIALNFHGNVMSSTYGRVYEHNLKAMQQGELSSVINIAWKKGFFNNALRPSFLFAISNYIPPEHYHNYLEVPEGQALQAEYKQGINQAYSYIYKTKDYDLSSVINYRPFETGLQQHTVNLSLGAENPAILWINHPGERKFSGENRPSFWAGNQILPQIFQYQNHGFIRYKLKSDVLPFIHLYFPFWKIDEWEKQKDWLFIKKEDAYCAIYFSNNFELTQTNAIAKREIRSNGKEHFIYIQCSNQHESKSFDRFKKNINEIQITDYTIQTNTTTNFSIDKDTLYLNNQPINYLSGYQPIIKFKTI